MVGFADAQNGRPKIGQTVDPSEFPKRVSLVSQVADYLEREIAAGVWTEWLPSERSFCETLNISRTTLRFALAHLKERNIIQPAHPWGTRIVAGNALKRRPTHAKIVGLLSLEPLNQLRPNVALIVDALRAHLAEIGYLLHVYHGERYLNSNSRAALKKLVDANPLDCWVLVLASEQVKHWFLEAGVKCVVSGSCSPDVPLPYVDLDYRALCRHAVGRMIAAGHKRLAYLRVKAERSGIFEAERGFLEGIEQAGRADIEGRVVCHVGTSASMAAAADSLFSSPARPTAVLVSNPNHYLFIRTYLSGRGLRVPEDVSLLCSDDDPFLSFVHPVPTRYQFSADSFAKRLFRLIRQVCDGQVVTKRGVQIMPSYNKGQTLVPPPA